MKTFLTYLTNISQNRLCSKLRQKGRVHHKNNGNGALMSKIYNASDTGMKWLHYFCAKL